MTPPITLSVTLSVTPSVTLSVTPSLWLWSLETFAQPSRARVQSAGGSLAPSNPVASRNTSGSSGYGQVLSAATH